MKILKKINILLLSIKYLQTTWAIKDFKAILMWQSMSFIISSYPITTYNKAVIYIQH